MGRRYVVFFEPALANLDAMGNHMATRLENQITDFLDAWRPEAAFAKSLQSDLWQFKWSPRNGSGARAFSGYFAGDEHNIALVLVTFKKNNEDKFNLQQKAFNSRAKSLNRTLDSKSPPGSVTNRPLQHTWDGTRTSYFCALDSLTWSHSTLLLIFTHHSLQDMISWSHLILGSSGGHLEDIWFGGRHVVQYSMGIQ